MHNIKTHEYSLGELLTHAWVLFKDNFVLIVALVLVVYVPVDILSYVAPELITNVVTFCATPIVVMAVAYAVNQIVKGKNVTFQECFHESINKLFWALGTAILEAILLFGLFLLFIIPGVIYAIYWLFTMYTVILHGKYGSQALKYSKSVVRGRWWKVFGISLLMILLVIAIGFPFIYLYPEMESGLGITPYALLEIVLHALVYTVSGFFEVIFVLLFINLDNTKLKTAK